MPFPILTTTQEVGLLSLPFYREEAEAGRAGPKAAPLVRLEPRCGVSEGPGFSIMLPWFHGLTLKVTKHGLPPGLSSGPRRQGGA